MVVLKEQEMACLEANPDAIIISLGFTAGLEIIL
jgi:hypothetical protein